MIWWQRFFRRKQMEAQLQKELSFHLERHANDLIARGQNPDEARRQARLALGGLEQVKEHCRDARGTRWLEDLLQDVRYALRNLRLNKGFAAVALFTLTLGTGATTVMFTVTNGVLLAPLPYHDPEKLLALNVHTERFGDQWFDPNFLDLQRMSRTLEPIAGWVYASGTLTVVDEVLAQKAFPHETPLGKQLWVPDMSSKPQRVIGVVAHVRYWGPAGDDQSQVRAQLYYPFAQVPEPLLRRW